MQLIVKRDKKTCAKGMKVKYRQCLMNKPAKFFFDINKYVSKYTAYLRCMCCYVEILQKTFVEDFTEKQLKSSKYQVNMY